MSKRLKPSTRSRPSPAIDRIVKLDSQSSAIALFDPSGLEHRRADHVDWWIDGAKAKTERSKRRLVVVSGPYKGDYRVRLTSALDATERELIAGSDGDAVLEVRSGQLHCTAGERVPCDGHDSLARPDQRLELPPGIYVVRAHALKAKRGAPDLVIELVPSKRAPSAVTRQLAPWAAARKQAERRFREAPRPHAGTPLANDVRVAVRIYTPPIIVLWDPRTLTERFVPPKTPDALLKEVRAGRLACAGTRSYDVRCETLVTGSQDGRWSKQVTHSAICWLRVTSGRVFCGESASLRPDGKRPNSKGAIGKGDWVVGAWLRLPKGDYRVDTHALGTDRRKPRFVFVLTPLDGATPPNVADLADLYQPGRPLGWI